MIIKQIRMQKTSFLISMLLVALLAAGCTSNEKALHKKLSEMAVELSASTPVMLDPYTRFDGALVTPENVFRYHYTVLNTQNPQQLVNDMMRTMESEMKATFATNPDLRIFTQNNVTVEYIYTDSTGENIHTVTIKPQDYK